MIKFNVRQQQIIALITRHGELAISDLKNRLDEEVSQVTLNRDLAQLVANQILVKTGQGRATAYILSRSYVLYAPIDMDTYFQKEPDQRQALTGFQFDLLQTLKDTPLFSSSELAELEILRKEYQQNITTLSPVLYQKELERLTIELSWKSAQIEGNTYSLLETEKLFLEKIAAKNKSKQEATMLLNHKYALDYLLQHHDLTASVTIRTIEDVHSLLLKELGVERNIRSRSVGITGTVYRPLDNEFQIREQLQTVCEVINARESGFEKALLMILLISYLQPFEDGNKRTARMMGNAFLINIGMCPLSYRNIDSLDYKKAMLLFYEQNHLAMFKQLFLEQNQFVVKNYFR